MHTGEPEHPESTQLEVFLQLADSEAPKPEQLLSVAGEVLKILETLEPEDQEKFKSSVDRVFPNILPYANSSAVLQVQKVAGQCAMLIGRRDDWINLNYKAFRGGDPESLFDSFDYLMRTDRHDQARNLLIFVWGGLEKAGSDSIFGEYSRNPNFLHTFATYAFGLDCDDIGYEIAGHIEGRTITGIDSEILRYKRVVRNPEEMELALGELWDFSRTGEGEYTSLQLLQSTREYMEHQINYLKEHDEIEPAMLAYLMDDLGKDEDDDEFYNFTTDIGRNFFAVRIFVLLAIICEDASRADFLLKQIENGDDDFLDMLHDILEGIEGYIHEKDVGKIIYQDFLVPLLDTYGGMEYAEIHGRIYRCMQKVNPQDSREIIDTHQTRTMIRRSHLSQMNLEQLYFPIIEETLSTLGPITKLHIRQLVELHDDMNEPQNAIMLVYYVLEYVLLYGKPPIMDTTILGYIKQYSQISPNSQTLLAKFYPDQF